jgi:hypothetical protein
VDFAVTGIGGFDNPTIKLYPQILAIIPTTPDAQDLRDEWNAWVAGYENWSDLSASLTWTQMMGLAGNLLIRTLIGGTVF